MFIGEKHAVDEAREIEEADCSDSDTSRRYGYPRCCGIAYGQYAIAMEGGWIEHYLSHLHGHDYMSFTANRIASLVQPWLGYHYDYFPCQPGCKESNEINEKNRSMLIKSDLAEFIELVDRHLNAAVVYHDGCIWYVHKEQFRSGNEYVCSPGLTAAVKNSHDAVRLLSRIHIHQNSVDVVIDGLLLSTADTSGLKVIIYE
jgi:hypothetical protein